MTTLTFDHLAQRLDSWQDGLPWFSESGRVAGAALAELATGEPVAPERIAARAHQPVEAVLDLLRRSPAEWDTDGRLVGFGLSLRPTRHRFEVDGRSLYAWCAPDTLGLPVVLGRPARVESPCFASGEPIRIEVAPDGVRRVDPVTAVVSIVTPSVELADVRRRLCHEQHFFASAAAAAEWHEQRPDAIVVSIADGFALTRRLFARWIETEDI